MYFLSGNGFFGKRGYARVIAYLLIVVMVMASVTGCNKKEDAMSVDTGNIETDETVSTEESSTAGASIMCGGWNIGIAAGSGLPEKVQERFDKAVADYEGMTFEPITVLATQVVAGINYALLCRATDADGVTTLKVVIIYANLQGGGEILSVKDISVADFNTGEQADVSGGQTLAGGWTVSSEPACELPDGTGEPLSDATTLLMGAKYEPLAVMGSQVVAGLNYAYVCRITPVVPDPVSTLNVVIVYRNLSGESEITSVVPLNIADYR